MIDIDNRMGKAFTRAMERTVREAVRQTLLRCTKDGGDVSVAIISDEEMKRLNNDYRHVDAPTDVLSFAQNEDDEIAFPQMDTFWGDIAISLETATAQAQTYGHALERELAFLAVHATLHLLGHDHMEPVEEGHMRAIQTQILEKMGVPR